MSKNDEEKSVKAAKRVKTAKTAKTAKTVKSAKTAKSSSAVKNEAKDTKAADGAVRPVTVTASGKKEVKLQESPIERALKLSSEQVLAMAIRDLIKRDDLN